MASFKYLDNGKVQITITHGTKFDGTPRRFYKTIDFTSKKNLEIEAALFLADVVKGTATLGTSSTIEMLYHDFIENRGSELKQSTSGRYNTVYNNQIAPYFSNRQLNKITRNDVRNWLNHILQKGNIRTGGPLKPKTAKNALSFLSTMYSYAMYDLEIISKNPCEKIRFPKTASITHKKEQYSEKELIELIVLLLQQDRNDYSKNLHTTLVFLILFTGLRTGEVMGLKWENIDFENCKIIIEEERINVPGVGVIIDTPKTYTSERVISIPLFVSEMLKNLKAHQTMNKTVLGDEYQDSGYVSANAQGTPQYPDNTYRWFSRFLKKNNMRHITIHDLRHTHAAILSGLGVKIIDVSKRLGHSNTRVTQEVYEYLYRDIDSAISSKLDDYFDTIKNVGEM